MVKTRSSAAKQTTNIQQKAAKVVGKAKTKAVAVKDSKKKKKKKKHTASKIIQKETKRETKSQKQMKIKILDIMTPLSTAMVVSRPSTIIKTPYIADVCAEDVSSPSSVMIEFQNIVDSLTSLETSSSPPPSSPSSSSSSSKPVKKPSAKDVLKDASKIFASKYTDKLLLAHAPSLDCAGMVISGSRVYTSVSTSSTAKSDCVIQFCEELREDGSFTKVGYHPFLAERISKELLNKHLIHEIAPYDTILSQQTFGKSRVDFVLTDSSSKSKTMTLLEVKNVVGADYPLVNGLYQMSQI